MFIQAGCCDEAPLYISSAFVTFDKWVYRQNIFITSRACGKVIFRIAPSAFKII
jgi:hypothetical protein